MDKAERRIEGLILAYLNALDGAELGFQTISEVLELSGTVPSDRGDELRDALTEVTESIRRSLRGYARFRGLPVQPGQAELAWDAVTGEELVQRISDRDQALHLTHEHLLDLDDEG